MSLIRAQMIRVSQTVRDLLCTALKVHTWVPSHSHSTGFWWYLDLCSDWAIPKLWSSSSEAIPLLNWVCAFLHLQLSLVLCKHTLVSLLTRAPVKDDDLQLLSMMLQHASLWVWCFFGWWAVLLLEESHLLQLHQKSLTVDSSNSTITHFATWFCGDLSGL